MDTVAQEVAATDVVMDFSVAYSQLSLSDLFIPSALTLLCPDGITETCLCVLVPNAVLVVKCTGFIQLVTSLQGQLPGNERVSLLYFAALALQGLLDVRSITVRTDLVDRDTAVATFVEHVKQILLDMDALRCATQAFVDEMVAGLQR